MIWVRVAAGLVIAALYVAGALVWRRRGASVGLHRWLCLVLGVRLRRFGAPGPGRRLIVANHVSWLDVLALGAMEPMAFLAKREVGADARTRWLVDLQGAVYVDRARRRGIPAVNAAIAARLAAGGPVTLFAEGTTSDGTRMLRFKSSHFEAARTAGALVQPVFLDYRRIAGMPATRAERAQAAWYGDMAFWPSLLWLLASGGVACDVHYGEPLPPDADRKALARAAQAQVRAMRAAATSGGLRVPRAPCGIFGTE